MNERKLGEHLSILIIISPFTIIQVLTRNKTLCQVLFMHISLNLQTYLMLNRGYSILSPSYRWGNEPILKLQSYSVVKRGFKYRCNWLQKLCQKPLDHVFQTSGSNPQKGINSMNVMKDQHYWVNNGTNFNVQKFTIATMRVPPVRVSIVLFSFYFFFYFIWHLL